MLYKALRSASNQRKLDVVPVLANGVIDDRPALQQRFGVSAVGQHDAIGALPNRHLADVAHAQIALALAGGRDCHATNILGAAGCDKTEITAHFLIQVLLNDAHAGRRRELEGAQLAGIGHQRDAIFTHRVRLGCAILLSVVGDDVF